MRLFYIGFYFARVELFNGKGGLVEGRIEKIDSAGVDFEALETPELVPPQSTQWHIFAAFSEFLKNQCCPHSISFHIPWVFTTPHCFDVRYT